MTANYTDELGTAYTETYNLSIPISAASGPYYTPTPSPTATSVPNFRPQIVITAYMTEPSQLQPGFEFVLNLRIENVGKSTAQRVTMILGGGTSSGGGSNQGTPDTGGVSGGSSNLSNFAPLASSNVQFLGDVPVGTQMELQALLIVNTSTMPGAYPLPISFTYLGEKGGTFTDDQVITLLVYNPPKLEVNFYRDPGIFFVGQPSTLPIQVVNLGRQTVVLGNMTVESPSGFLENNTTLIGPLDPGGYYTLDAIYTPDQPGTQELMIYINYTDDFNQPAVITDTISIEVQEMPVFEPEPGTESPGTNGEQIPVEQQPETIWQKIVRFFRGLFGLDSAAPTPEPFPAEEFPGEQVPAEQVPSEPKPVNAPAPKG
jgi:hypothetical protein